MPPQPRELEVFAESMYEFSDFLLRFFCYECRPCWPCGPDFIGVVERVRESSAKIASEEFTKTARANVKEGVGTFRERR